jgi:hypothetical protein
LVREIGHRTSDGRVRRMTVLVPCREARGHPARPAGGGAQPPVRLRVRKSPNRRRMSRDRCNRGRPCPRYPRRRVSARRALPSAGPCGAGAACAGVQTGLVKKGLPRAAHELRSLVGTDNDLRIRRSAAARRRAKPRARGRSLAAPDRAGLRPSVGRVPGPLSPPERLHDASNTHHGRHRIGLSSERGVPTSRRFVQQSPSGPGKALSNPCDPSPATPVHSRTLSLDGRSFRGADRGRAAQ